MVEGFNRYDRDERSILSLEGEVINFGGNWVG